MRKRITSLLLALVMLLSLVPALGGTARAAEEDKIEVHTYQQLQDALEQPGFNEIVLMEDIDAGELTFENYNTTVGVQEPIVIGANSFLWLDLNGHTLRLDTVFKLSHYIRVSGSSQLTIDDNSPGKTGKIIGHLSEQYFVDEPSAGVILVSGPEAVLNVVGGTIAGENCPAVHVKLGVAQISGDAKIQRIQDRKPFGGDSRVNKWPQKPALVVKAAGNNVPTVRIGPLPDVDANPQILGDVILDAEKIWEYGFGYDGKLWKESFLIITGGTFHGEVFSNFRTVSRSNNPIFEDIPALRIEGGTFHGKVTTCEWTCEGLLKGQKGYVQSYPAIKLLGGTFYDDVYLQKENRALRAKHLDNYRVKTALAHTVDNSMVVKEDGAYVGLNIWEGFDNWTLEPWSKTYPIMFKATREAPLTVIPNAWGVPKIKLDNDPVQYAKDWRGEVLELENNRQHTLVFQWDELPQAMKDEGYTYDVKLDIRRPDGTMASHSGNHLLVNQFVVTLPKGTKPGFYGYDLHLNLKKDGKLLGFVSNENIVRLKLKYAPEPDPALTGSVFHPSAIVYGRPISTAITGLPDGLSSDDLSYQWQWLNNSNDWENIEGADQASYTPGEADLRRSIRVTATAPGYLGQLAGASLKVSKAVCSDYPELKLTPTVNNEGQLTGFQVLDFDSDTYEYVYTTTLPAGGTWPTDGTPIIDNYGRVSGLTPGSTYYVTVRYKETETHLAGSWVRTEKVTLAPNFPLDRFELEGYRARGFGNDTIYLELGDSMDLTVTASPFYASAWYDTTFVPAHGSESLFTVAGPTLTSVPSQSFPEEGVGIRLTGLQAGTGELQAKYIDTGREMNYGSWKVVVYDDPQDIGVNDARFDLDPAAFSDVTMYDGRTLNAPDPDVTVYPEGAEGAYQYKWYVGKPYAGIGGAGTEYVTDNGYLAVDPHTGKVTAKQAHGADVDPAYKTVALFVEKDGSREKLASYQVTVEGAPTVALTGVILSPEQVRLKSGDTFQLTAAKIPADAPGDLTWESYNEDIATVDNNGLVTAVGPGYATIRVACGSESMTCEVLVDHTEHDYHGQDWITLDPANHEMVCNQCGDYKTEPHTFTDWQKVDDTTHQRTCTVCRERGAYIDTHYTQTANHNWQWVTTVEATLTTPGTQVLQCAQCGAVKPGSETSLPVLQSINVENLYAAAPVVDMPADMAVANDITHYVASTQWMDPAGNALNVGEAFKPNTVYSAKIILEAVDGYVFTASTTYNAIGGKTPQVLSSSADQVVLIYTFDKTGNSSSGGGTTGGGGSSSSGGGDTTYAITVKDAKNGDVTASHKSAAKGTTVTLTAKPDKGYVLDTPTVLDSKNQTVKLTPKDGKFTFTMPASAVTVKASFKAQAPSADHPFTDVPGDSWFEDAVIWAVDKGITGGTSATTFSPDGICTRAQAVTFLWRAAGSPAPKSSAMPFTDVPAGSWYYDAVLWAVEQGITSGTGATTFGPNQQCTRAQIVTFLWRAAGSPAVSGNPAFSDVASDAYYAKAVKWAQANGITSGIGGGLFGSNDNCTRAQIVTFIYRYMEK